jgi:excisionase family DNA binding protein
MDKDNQWLAIGEASKYLGVSRDTLRRWEKRGKIKAVRSPTNRRYYTKKQLNELMAGKIREQKQEKGAQVSTKGRGKKILKLIIVACLSFIIAAFIAFLVQFFLLP